MAKKKSSKKAKPKQTKNTSAGMRKYPRTYDKLLATYREEK